MKYNAPLVCLFLLFCAGTSLAQPYEATAWIRINQLGYTPAGIKVAVGCGKNDKTITTFHLVDSTTGKKVYEKRNLQNFGAYGPFSNTYRLDFSSFKTPGTYYLVAGKATSSVFKINAEVYK